MGLFQIYIKLSLHLLLIKWLTNFALIINGFSIFTPPINPWILNKSIFSALTSLKTFFKTPLPPSVPKFCRNAWNKIEKYSNIIINTTLNNDKIYLDTQLQQILDGNTMLDPNFENRQIRDTQSRQYLSVFSN